MRLEIYGTTWGMDHLSLDELLGKIKRGGYDGVEMGVPQEAARRDRLRGLLRDLELKLVAQQWTDGSTPAEHAESFAGQYRRALPLEPVLVNSHTGKDHFTLQDNMHVFQRACTLELEHGVPVAHETHRGRATFSAVKNSFVAVARRTPPGSRP